MSTTITESDLNIKFGTSNVLRWSDLENSGSVDQDRVDQSLVVGIQRVENAFRMGMYIIPFVPMSGTLTIVEEWMLAFAGAWLYFSRGTGDDGVSERMQAMADRANNEMRKYQTGRERLNAQRSDTMPTAPVVVR